MKIPLLFLFIASVYATSVLDTCYTIPKTYDGIIQNNQVMNIVRTDNISFYYAGYPTNSISIVLNYNYEGKNIQIYLSDYIGTLNYLTKYQDTYYFTDGTDWTTQDIECELETHNGGTIPGRMKYEPTGRNVDGSKLECSLLPRYGNKLSVIEGLPLVIMNDGYQEYIVNNNLNVVAYGVGGPQPINIKWCGQVTNTTY